MLWSTRNVKPSQGCYQAVTQQEGRRGEKFLGGGRTDCHGHSFSGLLLASAAFCVQRLPLGEEPYAPRMRVRHLPSHPDS